ncbi:uncharacterized protein LOC120446118 [Drosophila santomea]|uniref:uncharacterized protein LOC120446118 n=1 Tax=Drosophila santomea TaxID=129105 RepID=UPI001953479B|nr:uncharacterized protein LOC120446118 [Drosophila santomea]
MLNLSIGIRSIPLPVEQYKMSESDEVSPEVVGDAVPVPDTTPRVADTTTSGARMMMQHQWLVAAAVAVYATKVMWVKLANQMRRLQKQRVWKSDPLQDNEENNSGFDAETDIDCEEGDSDEVTDNVELVNQDKTEVHDKDRLVDDPLANFLYGI